MNLRGTAIIGMCFESVKKVGVYDKGVECCMCSRKWILNTIFGEDPSGLIEVGVGWDKQPHGQ